MALCWLAEALGPALEASASILCLCEVLAQGASAAWLSGLCAGQEAECTSSSAPSMVFSKALSLILYFYPYICCLYHQKRVRRGCFVVR